MARTRRLLACLAVCTTSVAWAAVSVLGTWIGTVSIDLSKLPPAKNAQEKKAVAEGLAQSKKARLKLVVKADKTYASELSGTGKDPARSEGTWKQEGTKLILTRSKLNGKPDKGDPQTLTVSADGKSMTYLIPNSPGKFVFSKTK